MKPESVAPTSASIPPEAEQETQPAPELVEQVPARRGSIRDLLTAALTAGRWLSENGYRFRRLVRLPWLLPALLGGLVLLAWRSGWHHSVWKQITSRRKMAAVAVTLAVLVTGTYLTMRQGSSLPGAGEARQDDGTFPSLSGREVVVNDSLTVHPAGDSNDRFVAPLNTSFEPLADVEPVEAEYRVASSETPLLRAPQPVGPAISAPPRWHSSTVEPTGYSIPETPAPTAASSRSAWLTGTIEVPTGPAPPSSRTQRSYRR